jgi:hypothetical protein
MSQSQKFQIQLHDLYDSDKNFIHKIFINELDVPLFALDSYNNTILHKMILNKDAKGIDLLLANLFNNVYNSDVKKFLLNTQNCQGNTAAHLAIMNDQQNVVKKLDKLGADLSIPNQEEFVIRMTESESGTVEDNTSKHSESDSNMRDLLSKLLISDKKTSMISNHEIPFNLTTISSSEFDTRPQYVQPKHTQARSKPAMPNQTLVFSDTSEITNTPDFINFFKQSLQQQSQPPVQSLMRRQTQQTQQTQQSQPIILSETSDIIDTTDFIRFLKQSRNQVGGGKGPKANKDSGIRGTRTLQNNDTVSNDTNTASDSLGIANIIAQTLAEQSGGRRKKSTNSKSKSKRLTNKLSSQSPRSLRSSRSSRSTSGSSRVRKMKRIMRRSSKRSKSKSRYNSSRSNSPRLNSSRSNSSRSNKPSNDVHVEVIEIIKKMGHSEDDARYLKAGLYQMVKDKFPNLSNTQRSLKLKEITTKDEVDKMAKHLPKLKELVTKAREQRKLEKENSPSKPAKFDRSDKADKADKADKPLKKSSKTKRSKRSKRSKSRRSKSPKRMARY